ncbi:MAG: YdcF family protein [Steroidobacteraceae bacterium]
MLMLLLQLKTLVKNLILPPTGPLLLALLGLLLLKRRPAMARACLIVGLGSLWLLSTPIVGDVLAGLAEHYPPLDLRRAADAQAIVILGGGGQRAFAPEYGGPAAEPLLLERLAYGAFLARKTGLPILVTGFRIEASAMQGSLQRNFAIDPRWVDGQAYDTFQNARNSARLLDADGLHRIVLVTHGTHMRRAVQEFTGAGLDVIPAPVGILAERDIGIWRFLPSPGALPRSYAAVNELLGEPVRALFAATHLRRQGALDLSGATTDSAPSACPTRRHPARVSRMAGC